MKKIIRLTEGDLHRMIRESVQSILKEFDVDDEGNTIMSDDEYNKYSDFLGNEYDKEDADMQEYFDDMNAEQFIGMDDHDPTDSELYHFRA